MPMIRPSTAPLIGPTRASAVSRGTRLAAGFGVLIAAAQLLDTARAEPRMLDPKLAVRTVAAGLNAPTSMAFLGPSDLLVLEKNTGKVQRVTDGAITGTVLDLPVNGASERGLLGIALHPGFADNGYVYLYWTQSSTRTDSTVLSETPLLGNRIDRFVWNGSTLGGSGVGPNGGLVVANIARLRALQEDAGQSPRGNHNGGVIRFGPDGNLYVFVGDLGRRGELQNLPCGPTAVCPAVADDQFGGPSPDNAHLAGVILRLTEFGSAPFDNPFVMAGADRGDEAGVMLQKVYSYGHRNGFGMAFDPRSGGLWLAENGDDAFDEINRITPGMNGGWVQVAGPSRRIAQYRVIETGAAPGNCAPQATAGLGQDRWPADNIAATRREARQRLHSLPGSSYVEPKFSWRYGVSPGALGFVNGRGLGNAYNGDLIVGSAGAGLRGGYLFRFDLAPGRKDLRLPNRRLRDRVADNRCKDDIRESEKLLIGENFGAVTDIQTGPNGNLYVVSFSDGAIYEISRR